MAYDPIVDYISEDFRKLSPEELLELFKDAKRASMYVRGSQQVKKVVEDITSIRLILVGYDAIHNGEHR